MTDQERAAFLRALDASELMISAWEQAFIESFLARYREWQFWTDGRRGACDKMHHRYAHDLEPKLNLSTVRSPESGVQSPQRPEADENGCEYLARREDRRYAPCNEPAVKKLRSGFRYCATHAEQVTRDMKRRGKNLALWPI